MINIIIIIVTQLKLFNYNIMFNFDTVYTIYLVQRLIQNVSNVKNANNNTYKRKYTWL